MLKTNDIQIEKSKIDIRKISVTFEDPEVQQNQYIFLKERLTTFKFYINSEYSLKSEIKYDKSSKLLLIEINIMFPEQYLPRDPSNINEILMDPIDTFKIFYDAQNEIYYRKHGNI